MKSITVKDGIAVYGPEVVLTAQYAVGPGFRDSTTRLDNASVIEVDALPNHWRGGGFTWDGQSLTMTPRYVEEVLSELKNDAQAERITKLEAARESGFGFNGHTVASDIKSQLLIQGSAQLAQLAIAQGTQQALDDFAASLGAGWRATDRAVVATSAAEIISMAQAFAGHVAACDANSQALKQAIIDAVTVADLEAIDLDAGWPA